MRFGSDGKFVKEWKVGYRFYGPRDISGRTVSCILSIGTNSIVRLDPAKNSVPGFFWSGAGQFLQSTARSWRLCHRRLGNDRIQVFDLDGKFVRQWKSSGVKSGTRTTWLLMSNQTLVCNQRLKKEVVVFAGGSWVLKPASPTQQSSAGKLWMEAPTC